MSQVLGSLARSACACAMLLATLCVAPASYAAAPDKIDVVQVNLEPQEDGWVVNAEFEFTLKPRLEEALDRGLPLYFVVEFELTHPRWYWFDDKAIATSLTYRLSYHALTREYRLSTGSLQLGFPTLAEALAAMTRVHDWHVAERGVIQPGQTYVAQLRMRLDTSQLPKPFQINAITSREWNLESDWKRFSFEAPR